LCPAASHRSLVHPFSISQANLHPAPFPPSSPPFGNHMLHSPSPLNFTVTYCSLF
jgi:hypothetical protein